MFRLGVIVIAGGLNYSPMLILGLDQGTPDRMSSTPARINRY
jgi:hypothetical protein